MRRIAFLGDVGGHLRLLEAALRRLGAAADTGELPVDLTVVQLGDLIDRGPESATCVALADHYMCTQPNQWIQLLGNHEGNRLGGPSFWEEDLDEDAEATLRRWWTDGSARLAVVAMTQELGEVVVTHGGIVRQLWELIGRPSATRLAQLCNAWVGSRPDLAFAAGSMLGGALPGPAWAASSTELYPSWASAATVPFSQVHGHSSACTWPEGVPSRSTPRAVARRLKVDLSARHEWLEVGGRVLMGIDPSLGYDGEAPLQALVLHGELLTA